MKSTLRASMPLVLSTTAGLVAAGLMFVPRGDAAPTPTTFSAETQGDVWRVNRLDLDMSGDPAPIGLDVARVTGAAGQAAAPNPGRSKAQAHNLVDTPAPAGQRSAISTATETVDTSGAVTAAGQAGTVQDVLDHQGAAMTARARWAGDEECLDPATPLTQSTSISQGSAIPEAPIPAGTPPLVPIPMPTSVPTEVPTAPPSGFPTGLPSDLPLPTDDPSLPTDLPTTVLPDLPTDLPIPLSPAQGHRAEGDVSMMEVAAASIEQRSLLEAVAGDENTRRVATEVVGKIASPAAPAVTFFGGEATLRLTSQPTLSAYSDGGTNGSQVTWTPPTMVLTVDGTDYAVPTDGSALALPYSANEDVVLTVSAGTLSSAESPDGVLAQASVAALNVIIKNGDAVVLDADLFPMAVKAVAPRGGVDCTPVVVDPANPVLKGKDNGEKSDKLKLVAVPAAAGADVKLFRVVGGKQKKVGKTVVLADHGRHVFKVKDKNGKKKTKYVVTVSATDLTSKGRAAKKVR